MDNLAIILGQLLLTGQICGQEIILSNINKGQIILQLDKKYMEMLFGINNPEEPECDEQPDPDKGHGHFSYDEQDEWLLESGKMQSPINIDTFAIFPSIKYEQLELNFKNQAMKIENNGHTIELGIAGESILMNRKFALNQMHFHAPSEHTIDGLYSDLEAHFVHTGADGRLAVVGVLFNVGKENLAFETILDHIPEGSSGAGFKINIDDLLPEDKAYYHYIGSLTTPPLTENVEWYVLEEKLEISQEQLIRFQKYYINNNRKTQPVNGRPINYINN